MGSWGPPLKVKELKEKKEKRERKEENLSEKRQNAVKLKEK